jgi:hypothetical protein
MKTPSTPRHQGTKIANQKSKIRLREAHSTRTVTRLTAPEPSTMLRLVLPQADRTKEFLG